MGIEAKYIWHKDPDIGMVDGIVLPGGFSYGDYLRSGAIARFSPVMEEIVHAGRKGMPVLGICNGFQVLLEAGMLPGTMLHNAQLRFICRQVNLRCESTGSMYTSELQHHQCIRLPVAHGEGNYYADRETVDRLNSEDRVLFRYVDAHGQTTEQANTNGSTDHIAAICNEQRNVMGIMPHPERAVESELGSTDGRYLFQSMMHNMAAV